MKIATPISIQSTVSQISMCTCDSGTRSKAIAEIMAPAPKPARMPTMRVGTVTQTANRPERSSDDCARVPRANAWKSSMEHYPPRFVAVLSTPCCPLVEVAGGVAHADAERLEAVGQQVRDALG